MSDMNTPEIPEVPASETAATEVPALAPVEVPALAPEAEQNTPEPDPVPVLARTASSESPTQAPESEAAEDETPVSLEDAARAVVIFVRAHRTIGDADLAAAIADVEAALPAQDAQV